MSSLANRSASRAGSQRRQTPSRASSGSDWEDEEENVVVRGQRPPVPHPVPIRHWDGMEDLDEWLRYLKAHPAFQRQRADDPEPRSRSITYTIMLENLSPRVRACVQSLETKLPNVDSDLKWNQKKLMAVLREIQGMCWFPVICPRCRS